MHTICELTSNMKVEKHENINVIGQGQPQITFLLSNVDDKHDNGTTTVRIDPLCFFFFPYCSQSTTFSTFRF